MRSNRSPIVASWLAVVAVGVATYFQMRHQPLYYDAEGYVTAAQGISDQGLLSHWPGWARRTYAFPLLLSWILGAAALLNVGTMSALFVVQWSLFVGCAWLASGVLFSSRRTRLAAFVAVAAIHSSWFTRHRH